MRERDGSMKKKKNREGNQQSKKIYSNRKKFQGFHPSPGSLMGKFAWRQFQSSPAQSVRPGPAAGSPKPRRRVGRYKSVTPRVLLGLHARNAMQDSDSVEEPRS